MLEVVGASLVGVLLARLYLNRRRGEGLRVWRTAADTAALTNIVVSEPPFSGLASLTGRAGPLTLRVDLLSGRVGQPRGTRLTVEVPGRTVSGVTLRAKGGDAAAETRGGREIDSGDPAFDGEFDSGGNPASVHAVLGAEARAALLRLARSLGFRGGVSLVQGALRVEIPAARTVAAIAVLPLLLEAARCLPDSLDMVEALAANARTDPHPTVRLHNLRILVREFGERSTTHESLRAATADASPEVRLCAATALGEAGADILLALAEGGAIDDACRAGAVDALGPRLPRERLIAILETARRWRQVATAQSCLYRLGRAADGDALRLLVAVLDIEVSDLALAAVRALGVAGPAAEPSLLAALHRGEPGVRFAVVEALGRAGTGASVPSLKDAAARHADDADFVAAVREAVAVIHLRIGGESRGGMSMAPVEHGQLSLADSESGRLSLPAEEPGRLSLRGEDDR